MKRILIFCLLLAVNAYSEVTPPLISFNSGEISPQMQGRSDFQRYNNACKELKNMFVLTQGPAMRRPGTRYIGQIPGSISYLYPAGYELTYMSGNAFIWGIPVTDMTPLTLDIDDAVNVGGGIVGLPCTGHPFEIGQTVQISGTTNYNAAEVLGAGTTANVLQVTATYVAETFNANSRVVEKITTTSGYGRMAQDSTGNLYYGHVLGDSTYLSKIETDGTKVHDFFTPGAWATGAGHSPAGVKVSSDSLYLYFYMAVRLGERKLYKFDLSDGSEVWSVDASTGFFNNYGNDIALDSDDNVYVCSSATSAVKTYYSLAKFSAANGTKTNFTAAQGKEAIWVDNEMTYGGVTGVVITGFGAAHFIDTADEDDYYRGNLFIRTLDNTDGTYRVLGTSTVVSGTIYSTAIIGSGCIWTYNDYIYVVIAVEDTLYKLNPDLTTADTLELANLQGGFFDLWGNLVLIQHDGSSHTNILHFYDEDLNAVTNIDNYYELMLDTWVRANDASNDIIQGNVAFFPGLSASDYGSGNVSVTDADEVVRLVRFEYAKTDAYVLAFGDEYVGFYREQ